MLSYLRAGEIEPEELTNDIMNAIGHPNILFIWRQLATKSQLLELWVLLIITSYIIH